MSRGAKVALNSVWLFGSEGLRRLIAFVVIFLVGRALAVEDFGRFRLSQSFFVIFLVIATFGMTPLIVKRIAAGEQDEGRFLGNIYGLKVVIGLLFLGLALAVAALFGYEPRTYTAIAVAALAIPIENLTSTHLGYYDGRQAMQYNGVLDFARGVVLLVGVGACVVFHGGLFGILAAYAFHYLFGAVFAHVQTVRRFVSIRPRFEWDQWKAIVREALPYVAIGVVWTVTFRVDMVMLSVLRNEESVGYYGAGYSLFEILIILPNVLTRALFPAFASARDGSEIEEMMRKSVRVFALVALPVGVGIAMTASDAVSLVFGEKYREGGKALAILGGGLGLWFCTMGFSWAMTAKNQLKYVLRANLVALFVNIAANAVLIPAFDFVGAAAATIISETSYLLVLIGPVHREMLKIRPNLIHAGTVAATVVMGACVWALRGHNVWLRVAAGVVVYAVVALVTGAAREPYLVSLAGRLTAKLRPA